MFEGTWTALVTPFRKNQVDVEALRTLVARQIQAGIHGLVACGTTGEAAAMSPEERLLVVQHVAEEAKGKVPVVAGTGTNNTRLSVDMTRKVAEMKVDGVLVVTPYYVKPPQRGLLEHYRQIAQVGLPIVAYNVPGRTGVSMTPETVGDLAKMDKVVALKEASGDLSLAGFMLLAAGEDLAILSGDDFTYLPLLAIGGRGCISVVSNVAPRETAQLFNCWKAGQVKQAQKIHAQLLPLIKALFVESNPIPVKAALALMGLCSWEIRTPLVSLSEELRPKLEKILSDFGVGEKYRD